MLGYDALQEMLRRGRDPSVLRPKGASEDAMVGVLLEDCSRCIQKRWENNQVIRRRRCRCCSAAACSPCSLLLYRPFALMCFDVKRSCCIL